MNNTRATSISIVISRIAGGLGLLIVAFMLSASAVQAAPPDGKKGGQ